MASIDAKLTEEINTIKARAFVERIEAVLLRVAAKPDTVFSERNDLVRELYRLISDSEHLAERAARKDERRYIISLLSK
jgi:plasmid stabilization system protein ParE